MIPTLTGISRPARMAATGQAIPCQSRARKASAGISGFGTTYSHCHAHVWLPVRGLRRLIGRRLFLRCNDIRIRPALSTGSGSHPRRNASRFLYANAGSRPGIGFPDLGLGGVPCARRWRAGFRSGSGPACWWCCFPYFCFNTAGQESLARAGVLRLQNHVLILSTISILSPIQRMAGTAILLPSALYLGPSGTPLLPPYPGMSVYPSGNPCSLSHSTGVRRRT